MPTILVIDDNSVDRERVRRLLNPEHTILEAATVTAATELVERSRGDSAIDIILLDLGLPDCCGIETLHKLRERGMACPTIILTGSDDDKLAIEALRCGAQDYLVKGQFDRASLLRAIRYAIERWHVEAQLAEAQRIAHIGSWEWNAQTRRLTCSSELHRILGRTEPLPDSIEALGGYVHPDDRQRVESAIRTAIRAGETFDVEHRLLRVGDELRIVLSRGSVATSASGVLLRVAGTAQDVTEQRTLREQLLISERMASVGTLAAGVGHEINNPLAIVMANLDLLAGTLTDALGHFQKFDGEVPLVPRRGDRPQAVTALLADFKDLTEQAREGADRVRQIVRDLKVFSRTDDTSTGVIDIRRVVDSSLRMAWNEIRHRARIVKDYGTTPAVAGNESRLGQVVLNVLVNAAQAIEEGDCEKNEIRIMTYELPGRAVIEIRDTGCGIPPENLRKVFDPFFTTKAVGVGTGLGLSICHRIIKQLGGEILIESTVGRGTTFRIVLPAGVADAAASARDGLQLGLSNDQVRRGAVLVIDDEAAIGGAIQRLIGVDHDVSTTASASQALGWIKEGTRYDVIVCDLMMPQMTGMELHDELSRVAADQAMRIIFLTGGAFTERARSFLAQVPNLHFEKPFDSRHLQAVINDRIR